MRRVEFCQLRNPLDTQAVQRTLLLFWADGAGYNLASFAAKKNSLSASRCGARLLRGRAYTAMARCFASAMSPYPNAKGMRSFLRHVGRTYL